MIVARKMTGRTIAGGIIAVLSACGAQERDDDADALPDTPAVIITSPGDGESVEGTFTLTLETRNVEIRPAGTDEPGTGHHHLFVDRDLTPVGEPIPTEQGIIHLGLAQTEYVFENLAPGEHTIVAVLGDYQHVRLGNVATDTLRVTVAGT